MSVAGISGILMTECGALVERSGGGKQNTWSETCPTGTLSTINPIWASLGMSLGVCVEWPAPGTLSPGK